MRIGTFFRAFFRGLDTYTTQATLRSRGEAGIASVCLGAFSSILLGLFLALFLSNLVKIVKRDSDTISFSTALARDFDPKTVKNVMFGITIQYDFLQISPQQLSNYFQMVGQVWNNEKQSYDTLKMKPCSAQDWKLIGQDYQTIFRDWKLNQSYCLPALTDIYSNKTDFPFAKLKLSFCNSSTNPNCKSRQQMLDYYNFLFLLNRNFPIQFSILTSYVQGNDKDGIKYYIHQTQFASTFLTGQQVHTYFDKFTIDTDISLLPIIEQHEIIQGFAFSQTFQTQFSYQGESLFNLIFQANLYTSKDVQIYNRNLSKIDNALSYVGGLFGIVVFVFNFFLQPYNQYRYELMASQSSFNYNSDGKRVKQEDFNILLFWKYRIHFWLNLITGGKFKWKDCQEIDETLVQSRKLLDVQKLFRRLQFMERLQWSKNNPNFLMTMALSQHNSIESIQNKKKMLDYYKQVIQSNEAATVEDAFHESQNSFKYTKQLQKQLLKQRKKDQNLIDIGNPYQNPQYLQQQAQIIKKSLIQDLKLQQFQIHCDKISKYVSISEDAQNFQLDQQFQDTQKQIAIALRDLDPAVKMQMLPKIPLKILHRLRICLKQKSEGSRSDSKKVQKKQSQNQNLKQSLVQPISSSEFLREPPI